MVTFYVLTLRRFEEEVRFGPKEVVPLFGRVLNTYRGNFLFFWCRIPKEEWSGKRWR